MFCDHCSGTDCKLVVEWLENCVAYSLFCIVIFIIISNSIISIYFIVLLDCLYLSTEVSPFVHFSAPFQGGKGRGGREAG